MHPYGRRNGGSVHGDPLNPETFGTGEKRVSRSARLPEALSFSFARADAGPTAVPSERKPETRALPVCAKSCCRPVPFLHEVKYPVASRVHAIVRMSAGTTQATALSGGDLHDDLMRNPKASFYDHGEFDHEKSHSLVPDCVSREWHDDHPCFRRAENHECKRKHQRQQVARDRRAACPLAHKAGGEFIGRMDGLEHSVHGQSQECKC